MNAPNPKIKNELEPTARNPWTKRRNREKGERMARTRSLCLIQNRNAQNKAKLTRGQLMEYQLELNKMK
jgi:hypothetical protein